MKKREHTDSFRKLLTASVILLALIFVLAGALILVNQFEQGEKQRVAKRIEEENQQILDNYQAKLSEQQNKEIAAKEEGVQRPEPAASGLDVVDLSAFQVTGTQTVDVTRTELIEGGLLLVNRWHELPGDFGQAETDLKSIGTETSFRVPVSARVFSLFPNAIKALDRMLQDAKAEGVKSFIVREGFRSMQTQTNYWVKEMERHTARYSGDGLIEKTRQAVSYPGTSDYQSGFSVQLDVYDKDDSALNAADFQTTDQAKWLNANSWKYGFVFRFPVKDYPSPDTVSKAYKTGINLKIDAYRYVGAPHAAVMQQLNLCLEEYIEYLIAHPHIMVYEDGQPKYEIYRINGNGVGGTSVRIPDGAASYLVTSDNMDGIIVAAEF